MTQELPQWFHVGAELQFHSNGPIYQVVSIDEEGDSWIAFDSGDRCIFPLSGIHKHWKPARLV